MSCSVTGARVAMVTCHTAWQVLVLPRWHIVMQYGTDAREYTHVHTCTHAVVCLIVSWKDMVQCSLLFVAVNSKIMFVSSAIVIAVIVSLWRVSWDYWQRPVFISWARLCMCLCLCVCLVVSIWDWMPLFLHITSLCQIRHAAVWIHV